MQAAHFIATSKLMNSEKVKIAINFLNLLDQFSTSFLIRITNKSVAYLEEQGLPLGGAQGAFPREQ